jgi:hypothetical protein
MTRKSLQRIPAVLKDCTPRDVVAGLVPAHLEYCWSVPSYRGRRDKPGDDAVM